MSTPTIVSGAISSVAELDLDEAWLKGWLQERPTRLGLGELEVSERVTDTDDRSFLATDDERCFSVDVRLGEMEAAHGFQLLDNWARNRVRHPDKSHVAVLVTEGVGERYQATLETLSEHLPLVVIELQVWRGENEAILVPYVALASDAVDLADTPAGKAAHAVTKAKVGSDGAAETAAATTTEVAGDTTADAGAVTEDEGEAQPSESDVADGTFDDDHAPENRDDTGVGNPWGLPQPESESSGGDSNGSSGRRLLTKIGG